MSSPPDANTWKGCSTCRKPIAFSQTYYVCNVSTCNRKRITYRFCSVECWEEHLPMMRHREAWAVEETAPTRAAWEAEGGGGAKPKPAKKSAAPTPSPSSATSSASSGAPRRRIRVGAPASAVTPASSDSDEILVVVSRFKAYVRERFDVKTAESVMSTLSDHLRAICHRAVENARADGRKTIMDRDFQFLHRR